MMRAATKRVRVANAMVAAMRVVGNKEGKGGRAIVLVTRVACNKECDCNGGKSNGNDGGGRATMMRAMATAMATATRVGWQWQ